MVSDCIIEELNYNATDVSIAHDDEQIEAHKMFEESCNSYRHPATDPGIVEVESKLILWKWTLN